jgi:ATP-dependent DNA ligase
MRATGTPQAAGDCLRMTIVSPRTARPELMLFDLMELDGKSLAALPLC